MPSNGSMKEQEVRKVKIAKPPTEQLSQIWGDGRGDMSIRLEGQGCGRGQELRSQDDPRPKKGHGSDIIARNAWVCSLTSFVSISSLLVRYSIVSSVIARHVRLVNVTARSSDASSMAGEKSFNGTDTAANWSCNGGFVPSGGVAQSMNSWLRYRVQ